MATPPKQWKSYDAQLELLIGRGMGVADRDRAIRFLRRVGYYRLSGYFHPFRRVTTLPDGSQQRENQFIAGSQFDDVIALYLFDRKLRLLALDAIERIELALQAEIAYRLGQRDVFAHETPAELHGDFTKKVRKDGKTDYARWLEEYQGLVHRARRKDFVAHNLEKYGRLPIWVAVEVWDFGALSKFYSGLQMKDKVAIEQQFGLNEGRHLQQWLRGLTFIRNVSAHHSRLWNCNVLELASAPRTKPHLCGLNNARPFLYFCFMKEILNVICPDSGWGQRFRAHMDTFPNAQNGAISLADMGVVEGWKDWRLWR